MGSASGEGYTTGGGMCVAFSQRALQILLPDTLGRLAGRRTLRRLDWFIP
jgi:hypothetical protein